LGNELMNHIWVWCLVSCWSFCAIFWK